jgi:hypothetical protein
MELPALGAVVPSDQAAASEGAVIESSFLLPLEAQRSSERQEAYLLSKDGLAKNDTEDADHV